MKKSVLLPAAVLAALNLSAENYIAPAPEGGFDISKGKDYVVLYAPDNADEAMGSKLITNNNLDPDQVKNYVEYWVCDWDPAQLTIYNVEEDNPVQNSFGSEGYINATPLWDWGTGVFMALAQSYDLSKVTDQHHIHRQRLLIKTELRT